MDTDKVSKLDDKQLDNVKGGILTELLLVAIPFIATGIGYGLVSAANHLTKKR